MRKFLKEVNIIGAWHSHTFYDITDDLMMNLVISLPDSIIYTYIIVFTYIIPYLNTSFTRNLVLR